MVTPVGGGSLIEGTRQPIVASGTTLGLGAWANYTDGSGQYIQATWTSSDTNVIAFDGTTMQAVGRGTATVTARADGMSDTETFTVEPNMAGTWSGAFVVDQCEAGSGSLSELICNLDPARPGVLAPGSKGQITFVIHKNGTDLTADVTIGNFRGTLSGIDRGANYLSLTGTMAADRTTITMRVWDGHVMTDVMEAQIAFEVRIDNLPSHANVVAHFDQVTRR